MKELYKLLSAVQLLVFINFVIKSGFPFGLFSALLKCPQMPNGSSLFWTQHTG